MTTVAIWGAAGNMGTRACTRLCENPQYKVIPVEVLPAGVEKLKARGDQPVAPEEAARIADVIVLAIADKFIRQVAAELVPKVKSGAMLMTLDPAAGYAGILPARPDITYFVTHPTHPSVFNDETDPEARKDYFGAGKAKQSIVSALMQGPEADYAKGEAIARQYFSPIHRSHRVTLEQMAILEPAMSETCSATFIVAMKEAMEEAIRRGVPREAAEDFLLGHINVQLAIVFERIDWKMSEGAYLVVRQAMKRLFRPDWKNVFDREELKESVRGIVNA
jgi:pyrroline-5-carboxylate reductase